MRKLTLYILGLSTLFLASCSPRSNWVFLDPNTSPPPMAQSGFAYDTDSQEGVIFGGIFQGKWSDQTWIWNGSNWRRMDVEVVPPAREKVAMAYDEARDRIVIFGGSTDKISFDDTWEWDGETWHLMEPTHTPPPRCCHAMAYDAVQKKVILYGGWNHLTGAFYNDTWSWDGEDWTQLPSGAIPLSAAHMLVRFASENKVVAVPSTRSVNTWQWDGSTWTETFSLPSPSRADGRSVYDSQYQRIILFGGIESGAVYLNDTWVFDGQNWNLLNLPSPPSPRFSPVMFYDEQRHSIILFGGATKGALLGDTWELILPEDLSGMIVETTPAP